MNGGDPLLNGFENSDEYGFETRAIRAGQPHDPRSGAVVTPIVTSTTFAQDAVGKPKFGYEYARTGNPTRHAWEKCLASLEEATYGLAFASGLAAEDAVFKILEPGDHLIIGNDAYGGTLRLIHSVYGRMGINYTAVDLTNPGAVSEAWTSKTRMVWIETPTNPLLTVFDIEAVAEITHKHKGFLIVDNTFATPYLQKPILFGADAVVHSTTKYLGGHSDVVGGFVATSSDALAEQLYFIQNAVGAVPSPIDCYLLLRGVKTLAVRMDRHCQNALLIVEMLRSHPQVKKVYYPGLNNKSETRIAKKQMSGFGGMISFRLTAGQEAAKKIASSTKVFTLAESLGAVESLIEHPGAMTHASAVGSPLEVPEDLIRLSIGIESISDLIPDLEQALDIN